MQGNSKNKIKKEKKGKKTLTTNATSIKEPTPFIYYTDGYIWNHVPFGSVSHNEWKCSYSTWNFIHDAKLSFVWWACHKRNWVQCKECGKHKHMNYDLNIQSA